MITRTTTTPEETGTIARELAQTLDQGAVVCLLGELGAGKSVFARALGTALGVQDPMPSPTFTIVNEYRAHDGYPVLHVDLYRISSEEEFDLLGIDEVMDDAITIVEWPERAPHLQQSASVTVRITIIPGSDRRTITIE